MTQRPSPTPLLELATAYQRSRVLSAIVELEIPTRLTGGTHTADAIAASIGAHPIAIDRLLAAAAMLGLVVRDGDRFGNTPEAEAYLVRGRPGYLGDAFHRDDRASTSRAWRELSARLRAWRPGAAPAPTREAEPEGAEVEGRHRLSLLVGESLARTLDLSGRRRLLDLGGGTGAMAIALCAAFPSLEAIVIDREDVAEGARLRVGASGLTTRIDVRAGDFLADPLPEGCDVALLSNVLSMLSAECSRALLARLFDALAPGGLVVLSGWMLDEGARGPLLPLLFSLEDIGLAAPDVERDAATYSAWLEEAGFQRIERAIVEPPVSRITGWKPGGVAALR